MRSFVPFVTGLLLVAFVFVSTTFSPMLNEAPTESSQARNQHPAAPLGHTESLDTEEVSQSVVRVDRPIFDIDYDDSWVPSVPEFIGGYRVLYISTPKSRACSPSPVIDLQTPQESLSGFLGDPPDVHALMQALPGLPPNVRLSLVPLLLTKKRWLCVIEDGMRPRQEPAAFRGAKYPTCQMARSERQVIELESAYGEPYYQRSVARRRTR